MAGSVADLHASLDALSEAAVGHAAAIDAAGELAAAELENARQSAQDAAQRAQLEPIDYGSTAAEGSDG